MTIDKKTTGLFRKFEVERIDGSSEPGGKHEACDYFVLDLDHDPHAKAALAAYADSCAADYPVLAGDLRRKVEEKAFGADARKCPRCGSPSPNLHPAMQCEGEVQPCPHAWHRGEWPRP